ncbi:hypothetical protein [Hymenobacter arizonensis]|uniref:hypothetical protein n=1 Tax=Hymenobacter arizonensis TaxID=1227077 RepID=UPI000B80784D|nr:hypothetical protein [Hymenobacter arizonensis]
MPYPLPAPATVPPQELLEALTDISLTGVVLYTPALSPAGEVVDFDFAFLNPSAQRMLGLPAWRTPTDSSFRIRSTTGLLLFCATRFCPGSRASTR